MSKLSLCEIQQSQLDKTPVVEGQLIICKDTGNMYRDFGKTRVQTGRDIEIVAELPLAPINGKILCPEVWRRCGCMRAAIGLPESTDY